ncbi:relaxin-3-like [Rhineura floridana]|uniref:relaxin-3-like n=1 Tax=Rhineura floridana TaxID=261503 RepID=UPI002AC7E831|nr:relaxin-3-like [Rhineura floridana]
MGLHGLLLLLLATGLPAELNGQSSPALGAATPRGSGPIPGGDYAVKLCGREFIRAVIFTCGGSRWKRIAAQQREAEEAPLPAGARAEFLQTSSDEGLENIKLQSVLDPELEQLQSISQQVAQQSLKDLFNIFDDSNEYVPTSNEYIHQIEDAAHKSRDETGLANTVGSYNFPLVKYPRRKRGFSVGVAGMCCKWGCTKTEISTLC